ncbi:hypothetical protein KKD70_01730 [Patescibacteria group bacterium]|nr:hypothetical protein [Patescibacteria group bacterium]
MKEVLKKLNKKWPAFLKIGGIAIGAIIVLAIIYRFAEPVFDQATRSINPNIGSNGYMEDYDEGGINYAKSTMSVAPAYDMGMAMEESYITSVESAISPMPTREDIISGDDAEDFEVTQYNASIETRHLEETCAKITELKPLDYVIFENSNEYDHGCNYTFKVNRDKAAEILAVIQELDPKDLSEYTQTIKRRVENLISEVEILENKMAVIDSTLAEAISAYDEITTLATRVQDVESLTKIITSKLQIIERLTQERINISERLDRLAKSKADQLDRLEYTYFNVSIYENKFVDGEELKDSWKSAIKAFVRDINVLAQDITINLAFLLLLAIQYSLYAVILLLLAKYGWKVGKSIWKK